MSTRRWLSISTAKQSLRRSRTRVPSAGPGRQSPRPCTSQARCSSYTHASIFARAGPQWQGYGGVQRSSGRKRSPPRWHSKGSKRPQTISTSKQRLCSRLSWLSQSSGAAAVEVRELTENNGKRKSVLCAHRFFSVWGCSHRAGGAATTAQSNKERSPPGNNARSRANGCSRGHRKTEPTRGDHFISWWTTPEQCASQPANRHGPTRSSASARGQRGGRARSDCRGAGP